MCGIFGATILPASSLKNDFKKILKHLFLLSESRGKEASGFAISTDKELRYLRSPFPATTLVKSTVFSNEISRFLAQQSNYYTAIGHSRLVTNGYEQYNENNQPVVKKDVVVVHNGIIVNSSALWKKYSDEEKKSDLDSELIPTLLSRFYQTNGKLLPSLGQLYSEIYGMTSIAALPIKLQNLLLATNNGSLYFISSAQNDAFLFASERFILEQLLGKLQLHKHFLPEHITHLKANQACCVNLLTCAYEVHEFGSAAGEFANLSREAGLHTHEIAERVSDLPVAVNTSMEYLLETTPEDIKTEISNRTQEIARLKRCTKCILPETFPFIEFDKRGICNYCNNYRTLQFKGIEQLKQLLSTYRSGNSSQPDCLVPFSGGRDSSYALHIVKKELGMNPIAFSYDWGMITDLARRNQARLCGKLGVEHILVSADIRKKRENIRKNVLAWMKRPSLGTIPLFMAGDKQYFYYTNLLMKQNQLRLSIMGENLLETTRFKSGFCGIAPRFDIKNTYTLSATDKLKMVLFYGKEYVLNPSYINSSLLDTLDAFRSYYVITHRNVNIYDYIPWEEEKIKRVLHDEYDWETDAGTKATWRIGDGTAAFYNYIYFMVAGFCENDTFRSNQIREGLITREDAMQKIRDENLTRFDSIQWYCRTIGIDWKEALRTINRIPALFARQPA